MASAPRRWHSRLATGQLRHRRFVPTQHRFDYRVWMLWLDLDELPALLARTPGFGTRRYAPARFRREDYLAPHALPLAAAVRQRLREELGEELGKEMGEEMGEELDEITDGPIRMLTQLRLFGVLFNPLTLYYVYDRHERLRAVLGEVTNTPWGERQVYACRVDDTRHLCQAQFAKRLHVSPFNPMAMTYRWRFNRPDERLLMHMETWAEAARHFDATLTLSLAPATRRALVGELLRHPLMTLKTIAAIHWQALRLWLKRTPIHDHPGREQNSP